MFVKTHAITDHPVRESIAALQDGSETWFPHLVQSIGERLDTHLAEVGFELAGIPLHKKVVVELGPVRSAADWLRVGVTWKPASGAALFPTMEGEFHLEPHTHRETKVTVSGSYEPPLGIAGRGLDAVVMHRAAEATFEDLARTIAAELDRRLAPR
jgi:hypothetical protein